MNEALIALRPYPFERLAAIRASVQPPRTQVPIDLSLGEPKHPTPPLILEHASAHLAEMSRYPLTRGTDELRKAAVNWLIRRFQLPPESISANQNVLPVNGTREALFAIAQCVVDRTKARPTVVMPNPFYQIYEGAALLAGAEPWFAACRAEQRFIPDFAAIPQDIWHRCQLLYLCSPGNPTGAVLTTDDFARVMELADRHGFVIASDECYSEIYLDERNPPTGLLQAAAQIGRSDYRQCLVFHSLSKRSNVPGLRSGFVAGDAELISEFLRYRTYHGCSMPLFVQAASRAAWSDEVHVAETRRLYREKFDVVLEMLAPVIDIRKPEAGFYLWPRLPVDDVEFTRGLLQNENVTVLPGSFLGRTVDGQNPGRGYVRIALVPPMATCVDAARRIVNYIKSL